MAMYDFKCSHCGLVQEQLMSYDSLISSGEKITCSCGEQADYQPSFWYSSALPAQRFTPVVIHKDAQGNIRYPGHVNAPVPSGFEKVELRDIHAIRKFEAEVNQKETIRMKEHQYNQQRNLDAQLEENRRGLDALTPHFTERGRAFAEAMRKASKIQQEKFHSRSSKDPGFYVEAFSQNSSNREHYRDNSDRDIQRGRK